MEENLDNREFFYIIVGCMYLPQDEQYIKTKYIKKETSVSNNVFERKLFSGFLKTVNPDNVRFISAPSVGWFPRNCKKLKMEGFSKTTNYTSVEYTTGYFGSVFSKRRALIKEAKRIIKDIDFTKFKVCLLINELHLPYLECVKIVKKTFGLDNSVVVQLVPDLPEFNNRSKWFFYKWAKRINCGKIHNIRKKYVDKYVLFSKPMITYLGLTNENSYIVNEGIASLDIPTGIIPSNDNKKHIVFIGKIDERNGVELIADVADKFIDEKDIVFDFYGISASQGADKNTIVSHQNIIMHGFTSPSSIPSILRSASVLLSPRFSTEEYTKYSFPSKIFDYLSAHKPIVSFKLDCYPKELDALIIYPHKENKEALFESIKLAMSNDYHFDINKTALFLSEHSEENVAMKIINLAKGQV